MPKHESFATPIQSSFTSSSYGNVQEDLPTDMPTPRGKLMQATAYQDTIMSHDLVTERAMFEIIHFINQTPIALFSKAAKIVETANYGSEFMVTRHACEQIIDRSSDGSCTHMNKL